MTDQQPFKWRHFQPEIILLCVHWYLRYALSDRDLEEMMRERGLSVDHTTIYCWVQRYAPELEKRCRSHLKACCGKLVKRGLYLASNGREINADINGAGNIIRKAAPDAFGSEGVEDGKGVLASLVVHPLRLVVTPSRTQKGKS